ncbi:MAG: META domain-containing protein, partial [Vitreimonas sp.]
LGVRVSVRPGVTPMRAALLALLFLAACATGAPPAAEAPAIHLAGTEWRRIDDENANPHGATLDFSAHGASGYTGCNRWFATVTQDGEALRFGDVGTTRMACGAGVQTATEQSFLAVLAATRYAHYDRDALVLLDENQQQIARFYSMR